VTPEQPAPRSLRLVDLLGLRCNLGVRLLGLTGAIFVLHPFGIGTTALSPGAARLALLLGTAAVSISAVPAPRTAQKPMYVVIGVTVNGERDILSIWAGDGGEGAKFWLAVLTEVKHRGVADVCIAVCDGLKGLPEAINTVWDMATVQHCIIHLIRNVLREASVTDRRWETFGVRSPDLPREHHPPYKHAAHSPAEVSAPDTDREHR